MTRSAVATSTRTLRVPHRASSVPTTRRAVAADLRSRELPTHLVDEAEITVAELLGNAVRHAAPLGDGTVRVHWQVRAGTVELEVTDGGGPDEPKPVHAGTYASSGRGLRIVRSLAHEWGVLDESRSRTVWASLGGPSRRRRV